MISLIIVFILFLSKLLGLNLVYNFLFIPFLIYLFFSDSKYVISKKIFYRIFLILFVSIFFIFFLFSSGEESLPFLFFRASSLSLFLFDAFGLILLTLNCLIFLNTPLASIMLSLFSIRFLL